MFQRFNNRIASKKAATEGTAAGGLASLLLLVIRAIDRRWLEGSLDVGTEAALVGVGTGLLAAGFRWLRSRFKVHLG